MCRIERPCRRIVAIRCRSSNDRCRYPIVHVITDEQKFDHALNKHHSFAITFWGSMHGLIFARLRTAGRLSAADMHTHLAGEFIDETTAEGVARARTSAPA